MSPTNCLIFIVGGRFLSLPWIGISVTPPWEAHRSCLFRNRTTFPWAEHPLLTNQPASKHPWHPFHSLPFIIVVGSPPLASSLHVLGTFWAVVQYFCWWPISFSAAARRRKLIIFRFTILLVYGIIKTTRGQLKLTKRVSLLSERIYNHIYSDPQSDWNSLQHWSPASGRRLSWWQ